MSNYISIIDETGRRSTLSVVGGQLEVLGVLPHCTKIQPASVEDANKLRDFLREWTFQQQPEDQNDATTRA